VGAHLLFQVQVLTQGASVFPTGTVTFFDESSNQLGTPQTLLNGRASLNFTGFTSVGTHSVTAVYNPNNSNFQTNNITTSTQDVLYSSSVTLTGPSTIPLHQDLTLNVSVTSAGGIPDGQVNVYDNGHLVGTVTLDNNGKGSLTLSGLTAGTHSFTAIYEGDNVLFAPSQLGTPLRIRVGSGLVN
jgi:hypothetical protein